MKARSIFFCLLASMCFAASAQEQNDKASQDVHADKPSAGQPPGRNSEQLKRFEVLMAKEDRGFVIPPPNSGPSKEGPKYSGQWVEKDGVRQCDGYLTRIENEEYCSPDLPKDWVPFKFENRTFYVQPLSGE